ncbi:hypothetical protein [Demequina zhanjiangensis]|uniref:Glycosyltransferase RgtA/B/C/D-like domain-containing protein n=1 Tax=Demequina zhanjiangensis TaxID=3051659 RepID=A0ABT8FXX6_9MICO|nr:hypothetical protein [Demequina sp. SYSU T00b26]MDN4471663.1 hypothetical protein [Demequina sp. SYSU T00b26]
MTFPTVGAPRATTPAPGARTRFDDALSAAPSAFVLVMVAVSLSAGVLVAVGQHRWWTVLPVAAVLIGLLWRPLVRIDPHPRAPFAGALLISGILAWIVANVPFAAEYLIVSRDPGFLSLSGLWLVDHPSTDIPASGAVEAAALQANHLADASQAWNLLGDAIQPQGAKMLPATIAVGGWFGGTTGVLAMNIVIGAAGLAAVYLLARRALSPLAALAPAAMLGLTVSHIGLSRAPYTEPLTLLLVIASVVWTWQGVKERSAIALAAGAVTSGATVLIRIDGAAFAVGALLGTVFALSALDAPRRWRRTQALTYIGLQAVTLVGGYAALYRWSRAYLERLGGEAVLLFAGYAVLAILVTLWAISWAEGARADRLIPSLSRRLGRRGTLALGAVASGLLVLMASRPLWMVARRGTETSLQQFTNGVVESFQQSAGLEVDGTRTYAETTVTWLSYYLTWPVVALAILGFGLIVVRALRKGPEWWLLVMAFLPSTLLYLWRPSIVPDQIWAIRRFEPATLPGFVIAAAIAAWWLAGRLRTVDARARGRRVAAIAFVLLPLSTWVSVMPDRDPAVGFAVNVLSFSPQDQSSAWSALGSLEMAPEMGGARSQLEDLCEVIDGRPVVLAGTSSHFGSIRVMCDVPVVLALEEPSKDTLTSMIDVFGEPPMVLIQSTNYFEWTSEPYPVVTSSVVQSGYSLQRVPVSMFTRDYRWNAALVNDDGTVTPIAP